MSAWTTSALPPAAAAEYPFRGREHRSPGGTMHYLDEGPRDGEVVLCLHGNPTWSFYWRALVRGLADRRRIVVPDHVGCGLSEKPQAWSYRLADHVANLESLVLALDLRRITLVVHDWGGAIGFGFARRHPERIARLVITNTAAFPGRVPWRIRACRTPVVGEFLVRRMNAFAGLAPRMASARRGGLPSAARAGLLFPYDSAAHRIAIARFVQDIPTSSAHPSWAELAAIEASLASFARLPACIVWGGRDWCFSARFLAEWRRRFPRAEVHALPEAGHYLMEDAPDEVVGHVRAFLEREGLP
jgi:haloalkane dehalogenase